MVEIEGERVLAASCIRKPAAGMKVKTPTDARQDRAQDGDRAAGRRPAGARRPRTIPISKFWNWADKIGVDDQPLSRAREQPAPDRSHPAMAVNLDACIQCNLCVRACREVQVNDVIGMACRGHNEKIVFDFDDPMGDSTCVACGECVQACPTGALMPSTLVDANNVRTEYPDRAGRQRLPLLRRRLPAHLQHQGRQAALRRRQATARPTRTGSASRAASASTTSTNPQRLTKPLIRKDGVPKRAARVDRSGQSLDAFPRGDLGRGARRAPPRA